MKRIGFLALLLLSPVFLFAQGKLNPDILWKFGRVSDPQLSPDGKIVIFGVRTADVQANKTRNVLYMVPLSGGNPIAIADPTVNASQARWRADGKKIGFLSAKSGSMQMWEMNADASNMHQVTNDPDGIDLFSYSPKGTHILFAKSVKVDKMVSDIYPDLDKSSGKVFDGLNYRHWDTWSDGTYSHIFIAPYADGQLRSTPVDIMPGKAWDSPVKPDGGDEQIAWGPDGNTIAYSCKKLTGTDYMNSTNTDVFLYNIQTGAEENITASNPGYDKDPSFSPDGKYIAYLSMEHAGYESDKNRLMLYDLAAHKAIEATATLDQTTDAIAWAPNSKKIYFISETQATKQIYEYVLLPSKKEKQIKAITDGWHDYVALSVAMDLKKEVIVGEKMSISMPGELFIVDPVKGKETQLTFTNKPILNDLKMGKVVKRMIKATDGKDILTWVIYPPDFDSTKKYPALLYCQGGPQSAVSQFFSFRWNFQIMAANGYIIVAPNRRGLQSFGQEWCDAIVGDYSGQPMQDLLSAIDKVSEEKYVDKNKLGAVGASFGGYTVYWLAGHNQNKRFKTFIAHDGMFDMESWYGSTEEMWFANHDQKGSYWENPGDYNKFSPIHYVKNWNTPILIIHSDRDYRVPMDQGLEAFTAAQEMHIPSRLLYFPDENHWILKPQNGLLWQRTFFDWLGKTLK